ncbi:MULTISPECIES: exopolysaccharide biosynthesis protein [Roseovarius]|uniref:exopolysaccharide biosynthesis protein n=1 Tax=Roseovarius TaxID=74030 RepID=UPI001FE43543|nr:MULTISPECIES: exopolysaccharide biosynthesis protein [Roseovarius]
MKDDMAHPETSSKPITAIIDRLEDTTDRDQVTLRCMIEAFGKSSFTTAMCVPALLVASPLSGIPLFSSACGLLIASIAAQMLVGRDHLWLPAFVMNRSIGNGKMLAALRRLHRIGERIDAITRPRLRPLMTRPFRKLYQALCVLCGVLMVFLEIVPFSSSVLGMATIFFATAIIVRDGVLACLGVAIMCLGASLPIFALQAM